MGQAHISEESAKTKRETQYLNIFIMQVQCFRNTVCLNIAYHVSKEVILHILQYTDGFPS